jgi:hypothetical protein
MNPNAPRADRQPQCVARLGAESVGQYVDENDLIGFGQELTERAILQV